MGNTDFGVYFGVTDSLVLPTCLSHTLWIMNIDTFK
jgi:hypothetical protein